MAINKQVLKPHAALRNPLSDSQQNGKLVNPPMYTQFGGAKATDRIVKKADLPIRHVGD